MNSSIYIPERFKRAIILHIVKNLMESNLYHGSLILGIHGPSGYGKTYQCECVLKELGAELFLISGGQLESGTAGEPAQIVRQAYINASRCIEQGKSKVAVVLINDIDTGLGNWGDKVQYTINRQTVFGELMHIVDYPTMVEGRSTRRIPIIITGNDFTKLYEPLVRPGRMTAFEWDPTNDEKTKILHGIYPELQIHECEKLIDELNKEISCENFNFLSIAFFSYLRSTLIDGLLTKSIEEVGVTQAIDRIGEGREPIIHLTIRLQDIVESGKNLIHSGKLVNHLRGF
ncbi:AAA family ATPase [Spirulina sp. 06S082]|uniref:AAA family ATPase n=1 Tax=Spirulina sp. 06S082 TaxID=3110248 RepID=UPI002B1FA8BC|nr:AAA family ATPase [Spirulina sp. 06S082]MEA5470985.1 AAA family ATPase [Spirulina sp. 06S082]